MQTQQCSQGLIALEKAKARLDYTLECSEVVNKILREGVYYHFPKIHVISHHAEQIPKFGSLPQ